MRALIYFCLLVCLLGQSTFGQTVRRIAPADILRIPTVGDPQISPNGERVAYTVATVEGNETHTTIWVARSYWRALPGATSIDAPYRLLPADWSGSNPRWSPDSKRIAFLSTRDEQRGIWVVTVPERVRGAAVPMPRFVAPVGETNFFITYAGEPITWSPDSTQIAYISAAEDDATGLQPGLSGDDPRVIDRIQYKSRTSLSDRQRTHVWLTRVDNPEPRQLTRGLFYDHALSFSPRGDEIAFISNHEFDPDANNNSDIFAVDLHGQVRQITQTRGCEYEPAWSPDGRSIAYVATTREVTTIDSAAEDTHVWVISAAGRDGRELAVAMDRRARGPRWTDDGKAVLFLAGNHGRTFIYRVGVDDGKLTSIFDAPEGAGCPPTDTLAFATASFQVGGFSVSSDSNDTVVAFTVSTASRPAEVYVHPAKASCATNRLAQVSETGAPFAGPPGRAIGERQRPGEGQRLPERGGVFGRPAYAEPEEITFKGSDGTPIQGWLLRPTDWRPDRKYPMILSIHGGPHGMYGYAFNPAFHVYASHGYAVLYLNPRGSSGYGQKFSDGTLNEWGGGDYRDLMAGVDEALKKYPWIDPDRIGVTGGSYGGFMTNWIITQTTRFKAAVSSASVSNLISFYSTSLYQDLIHAEFGGFPWDNYDQLWQWSPLRYAKLVQTPTLFIHGEQDNDVPITQAEEMYMALKRRGVETLLVRYPREGHGLREPRHRVDALERTLAWFDRFLK